jgi:hypothetical protein
MRFVRMAPSCGSPWSERSGYPRYRSGRHDLRQLHSVPSRARPLTGAIMWSHDSTKNPALTSPVIAPNGTLVYAVGDRIAALGVGTGLNQASTWPMLRANPQHTSRVGGYQPVVEAPVITRQPADQTVVEGDTATFEVVASGTQPLTISVVQGRRPWLAPTVRR